VASIVGVTLSLALGIGATLVLGSLCYFLLIPISLALLQPDEEVVVKATEKPRNVTRKSKSAAR
jgi:hypothetical protein